jgi:hypothetical protein
MLRTSQDINHTVSAVRSVCTDQMRRLVAAVSAAGPRVQPLLTAQVIAHCSNLRFVIHPSCVGIECTHTRTRAAACSLTIQAHTHKIEHTHTHTHSTPFARCCRTLHEHSICTSASIDGMLCRPTYQTSDICTSTVLFSSSWGHAWQNSVSREQCWEGAHERWPVHDSGDAHVILIGM